MLDKHNNTNDSMTTTENQFVKMLTPTRFRQSTLCSNDSTDVINYYAYGVTRIFVNYT